MSYNHAMSANDANDKSDVDPGAAKSPRAHPRLTAQLRNAAAFLTRLPMPLDRAEDDPPDHVLAQSMPLFPLVGAGIGACGALVLLGGNWLALPLPVACILALGALVWLTGALHEDGLADVADGFGGGSGRAAKLAIMHDSRIGSYGVLALIVSFALKTAALIVIATAGPWLAAAALIATAAWSRSLFAPLMLWLPAARSDGVAAGAGLPGRNDAWRGLILGAALALLMTIGSAGAAASVALIAGGFAAFLVGWLAFDHVGGYTGDILGAAQQAAETTTLVVLSALLTGG